MRGQELTFSSVRGRARSGCAELSVFSQASADMIACHLAIQVWPGHRVFCGPNAFPIAFTPLSQAETADIVANLDTVGSAPFATSDPVSLLELALGFVTLAAGEAITCSFSPRGGAERLEGMSELSRCDCKNGTEEAKEVERNVKGSTTCFVGSRQSSIRTLRRRSWRQRASSRRPPSRRPLPRQSRTSRTS